MKLQPYLRDFERAVRLDDVFEVLYNVVVIPTCEGKIPFATIDFMLRIRIHAIFMVALKAFWFPITFLYSFL